MSVQRVEPHAECMRIFSDWSTKASVVAENYRVQSRVKVSSVSFFGLPLPLLGAPEAGGAGLEVVGSPVRVRPDIDWNSSSSSSCARSRPLIGKSLSREESGLSERLS